MELWNNNKPIPMPLVCSHCGQKVTVHMDIQTHQDGTASLIGDCPNCQETITSNDTKAEQSNITCSVLWKSDDVEVKTTYKRHTPVEICMEFIESACHVSKDIWVMIGVMKELLASYNEEGLTLMENHIKELRNENVVKQTTMG